MWHTHDKTSGGRATGFMNRLTQVWTLRILPLHDWSDNGGRIPSYNFSRYATTLDFVRPVDSGRDHERVWGATTAACDLIGKEFNILLDSYLHHGCNKEIQNPASTQTVNSLIRLEASVLQQDQREETNANPQNWLSSSQGRACINEETQVSQPLGSQ